MSLFPQHRCGWKRKDAFALIVSLVLLSFLVLLTVTLSGLVVVEIRSSKTSRQLVEAEQNARIAMTIAVGNLQKYAGQDQRVTANPRFKSDVAAGASAEVGNLTAVYDSTTGKLLSCLGSGLVWPTNENPELKSAADALQYKVPVNSQGSLTSDEAVLLVGPNTLGADLPGSNSYDPLVDNDSNGKPDGIVAVPKLDIDLPVPGQDDATRTVARYAYWVGDENVKARINLPGLDESLANTPKDPGNQFALTAFQGSGTPLLEGMESFPWRDSESLNRVIDSSTLGLLDGDKYVAPASARWHDLTVYSAGVLSDTRRGGLKQDLSLAFEMSENRFNQNTRFAGDSSVDWAYINYDARYVYDFADPGRQYGSNLPSSSGFGIKGPTWHALRSHYRLYKELESSKDGFQIEARIDGPLQPDSSYFYNFSVPHLWNMQGNIRPYDPAVYSYELTLDDRVHGIKRGPVLRPTSNSLNPVITSIRYLYSLFMEDIADTEKPGYYPNYPGGYRQKMSDIMKLNINPDDRQFIQIKWDPVVTLWNPYNVSITFDALKLRTREIPTTFEVKFNSGAMGRELREGQGGPQRYWRYSNSKPGYLSGSKDIKFGDFIGNRSANDGFVDNGLWFVIGEPNKPITLEPGELKVFSFAEGSGPVPIDSYLQSNVTGSSQGTSVVLTAREGWDNKGGLLVDTSITGNELIPADPDTGQAEVAASEFQIRPRSRLSYKDDMNYYLQAFILKDYDAISDALKDPDTDPNQQEVFEYSAINLENTQFVEIPDYTDYLKFGDGGLTSGSPFGQPIGQMVFTMKPAETVFNPVSLARYNNIRARTNARLPDQKYEVADPLWLFAHEEYDGTNINVGPSPGNHGYWGSSDTGGNTHVTAFEVPAVPMASIGSLKHANVNFRGHEPMYAMGDSYIPAFLDDEAHLYRKFDNDRDGGTNVDIFYADRHYLLNDALWDGYFFSTLAPQTSPAYTGQRTFSQVLADFEGGRTSLPNPRMKLQLEHAKSLSEAILDGGSNEDSLAINAPTVSAAYLLNEGAFNVNSTSVSAWTAVLGAMQDVVVPYLEADSEKISTDTADGAAFSRFGLPNGDSNKNDLWRGFVRLTRDEIESLAESIVEEVKERGPFLSLADFVNRKVVVNPGEPADNRLLGALQEALEDVFSINSDHQQPAETDGLFDNPKFAEGSTFSGAAGYLTQSDLLVGLGPVITNRSDTFKVRAYGEVIDPVSGQSTAKRWLEAVVQRTAEPVKRASQNPDDPDYHEYFVRSNDADEDNRPDDKELSRDIGPRKEYVSEMGRRFKIVSMRWLNEEEI